MEITTSTIFSPEEVKALQMALLYNGKVPNKTLLTRVLIGVAIFGITVVLTLPFGFIYAVVGGAVVGCILFMYYVGILLPHFASFSYKFRKTKRPGSPDDLYTLTFRDDDLRVLMHEEKLETDITYPYRALKKVVETGEYFLIYVNDETAMAAGKACIDGESAKEICERITAALGKKYIIARY